MAKRQSDGQLALELRNLSKAFGHGATAKKAVCNVSLGVHTGEVYGFLGPNGAGKSTTIRMALGLIRPNEGRVLLFGKDSVDRTTLRRVGSLVDGGVFYPFLSGRENLRVLSLTQGGNGARIDALLDRVDLIRDANRKVKGYSMGMRQRLGVAAALLNDPDLVILDEPANGLDAAGIQDMRVLLRGLADEGKAVFLSSHLLHEVEQVCDRVAIVAKGHLLREASVREMLDHSKALFVEVEPIALAIDAIGAQWPVERIDTGLRVQAPREAVPMILRRLSDAGTEVFRIGPEEQTLEDIFLSMTKDADV